MASRQLDEISKLEAELEKLFSTGNESKPEIEELKNENSKLIYQINTLKKSIQKEKADIVPPKGSFFITILPLFFDTILQL